jgi:hypothetical protein
VQLCTLNVADKLNETSVFLPFVAKKYSIEKHSLFYFYLLNIALLNIFLFILATYIKHLCEKENKTFNVFVTKSKDIVTGELKIKIISIFRQTTIIC